MKLVVVSHKPCWRSPTSPTGFATDGGFPFQMRALSELFDATVLVVPGLPSGDTSGDIPLVGHNLSITALTAPAGRGIWRKLSLANWLLHNGPVLLREIRRADAVHAPIPGDIGTFGMLMAFALRKPLFVRHCGNWSVPRTAAEYFWRWIMIRFAGGRNVMLATGGAEEPPAPGNPELRWIFASSLTQGELTRCAVPRDLPDPTRARLITVCRQERAKGTGVVIQSLPYLKEFPRATLDVVGDGGALAEFMELAAALNVQDRVIFHRRVNHATVIRLLQQADLFCYPTAASEGFPKSVLEALACGLPVITTPVSVLPQLIGTGCGCLLEQAAPAAVAEAVRGCFADPAGYRRMSTRAIETAAQYSLERWRDTIGDLLRAAWKEPSIRCLVSKA